MDLIHNKIDDKMHLARNLITGNLIGIYDKNTRKKFNLAYDNPNVAMFVHEHKFIEKFLNTEMYEKVLTIDSNRVLSQTRTFMKHGFNQ